MALINKLKAIGDAIRAKTGKTDELTLDQMVTEIEGIEGGGSGGDGGWLDMANAHVSPDTPIKSVRHLRLRCVNETEVLNRTWFECDALEAIELPKATTVHEYAFAGCWYLSKVIAPVLTTINDYAFHRCASLVSIDLPSATSVGEFAFGNCTQLTSVILRSTSTVCVCALTALDETPMLTGEGHIYVPAVMYEYYRAGYEAALDQLMPGFFDILFRKIEDYPEICG